MGGCLSKIPSFSFLFSFGILLVFQSSFWIIWRGILNFLQTCLIGVFCEMRVGYFLHGGWLTIRNYLFMNLFLWIVYVFVPQRETNEKKMGIFQNSIFLFCTSLQYFYYFFYFPHICFFFKISSTHCIKIFSWPR